MSCTDVVLKNQSENETHMTELLPNFLAGRWQNGSGAGTELVDPVLGTPLVRVDATGLDLSQGFAFARQQGGARIPVGQ